MHPYLAWMFINPATNKWAQSVTRIIDTKLYNHVVADRVFGPKHVRVRPGQYVGGGYDYPLVPIRSVGVQCNLYNKTSMICYNRELETCEFRAFDAAATWEEQEEMIAFVQRFVDWSINDSPLDHFGELPSPKDVFKSVQTVDAAVNQFKQLVDTISLPYDRYEKYVDLYLKPAYAWGDRR